MFTLTTTYCFSQTLLPRSIDEIPIDDFLVLEAHTQFLQDPDAQYNSLFWSPATKISYGDGFQLGSYLVDFPDSHNVRFSNGSSGQFPNMALIRTSFSELDSGEKLHQEVEVPKPNATLTTKLASDTEMPLVESLPRYPSNPVAIHKYGGYISGYLLEDENDNDMCVLAAFTFQTAYHTLPGYNITEDFIEARRVIRETLSSCKVDGRTRLIVDMSANDGGYINLGYELYRNLFPQAKMWTGSRIRAHPAADLLGRLLYDIPKAQALATAGESQLYPTTGTPFKTWKDLYGPVVVNVTGHDVNELESNLLTSNQSTFTDGKSFYLTGFAPKGLKEEAFLLSQPFDPPNIVVLTNGICISTCAIFTGLMVREQGVRTIVVGGRPLFTPMQAIGGTKGSQMTRAADIRTWFGAILDADKGNVTIKSEELAALVPSPDLPPLEPVSLVGSGVNFRNAYVDGYELTEDKGDDYPTQFIYEAANCRMFYTAEHLRDVDALWRDVRGVAWNNGSCAPGSTVKRDGGKWIISDQTPEFTDKFRSRVTVYNGPGSLTNDKWQKYGRVNTTGYGGGKYELKEGEDYEMPGDIKERVKEMVADAEKKESTEKKKEEGQRGEEQEGKKEERSVAAGRTGPGMVQMLVVVAVGILGVM